jgi:hypothetical protein
MFRLVIPMFLLRALWGGGVTVRFDPSSPDTGPFPTDALTVADPAQKTGRRINIPLPDCQRRSSDCEELAVVNEYDGFSLFPRIRARFSGPVDTATLREGIFFVAFENLTNEEYGLGPTGKVIPINQVIYDPQTHSVYAKPDELLDQHRRYALIVTSAVRDQTGDPIQPDQEFLRCLSEPSNSYCRELAGQIGRITALAERLGWTRRVIAASVFTTMSATVWLEKVRDLLPAILLGFQRTGLKSAFNIADLATIVFRRQVRRNPSQFQDVPVSMALLDGVGRIVFGSYRSPNFLNPEQLIPQSPTGVSTTLPAATAEIQFHVLLPATAKPPSGYPVVIAGHAYTGNRFGFTANVASTLAKAGYAIIAIGVVGHGSGAEGKVVLTEKNGAAAELPAGGRSIDMNGDGAIDVGEGCFSLRGPFGFRDCLRQTVVDLMQLVRLIRAETDVDGDGTVDLDSSRIYYTSLSLGSFYGTILAAVEPGVSALVLNVGGASMLDSLRWSPSFQRDLLAPLLGMRTPPVAPNKGTEYEENYVLRHQPVKVNDVPVAMEIQNIFEMWEWIQMPGDPLAFAPHLRASTLPGVPIKRILFQIARGDQSVPNPMSSALARAAYMTNWSALYRHDLARAVVPQLAANPHTFSITYTSPESTAITLAAQEQAVGFFVAAGRCGLDEPCIPDVNGVIRPIFGKNLFETPEVLPEDLAFLAP